MSKYRSYGRILTHQKLISVFLVLSMFLSMLPAAVASQRSAAGYLELGAAPEFRATVYVSASGDDTASGSASAPVATMAAAYAVLAEQMSAAAASDIGRIVIADAVTVSAGLTGAAHEYAVYVTGGSLTFAVDYTHPGPTVYNNIELKRSASNKNIKLIGNGPLTLGENVTTDTNSKNGFFLVGSSGGEGDTWVLVESGTWRNIYFGTASDEMTGNANLEMRGGKVNNYLRGTYEGQVNGNVTATLKNGAETSGIFYATDSRVTGTVTLNAENAILSGQFNGVSAMTLNLSAVSDQAPVMTITTPNDSADRKVNNFTGGGKLKLGSNVSMTVSGTVTGTTEIVFDGIPTEGMTYVTAPVSTSEDAFTCGVEGYTFAVSEDGTNRSWTLKKETGSEIYPVVISSAEYGRVVASHQSAAEGDTVSLTVLPDSGYALETLGVKDAQSADVVLSNNAFTMPAGSVTVSAVFAKETAAANAATVYVSASGDNTASGSETAPVATLEKAYSLLLSAAAEEGRIVLLDTLTISEAITLPEHSFPVVITGASGENGIAGSANLLFNGPTTLENLTLECTVEDMCFIVANGHSFTVGENVSCKEGASYFNLVGGGYRSSHTRGSDMTVKSGRWNNVYAASYNGSSSSAVFSGGAKLVVTGGTITTLTGSSFAGNTSGSSTVIITGGEITGLKADKKGIYACGMYGSFTGEMTFTIAGESADSVVIADTVVGGIRQSSASVTGSVSVNISGATLLGGIDPQGGGSLDGSVRVNLSGPLALSTEVTANTFTGGSGTLMLGKNASLTVSDKVTGNTAFTVEEPANGTVYITAPTAAENAFTYSSTDGSTMTVSDDEIVTLWTAVSDNMPAGLTLTAPSGVTLTLYSGLEVLADKAVTADSVVTENGITTYFYGNLSAGKYCYRVVDNSATDGVTYYKLKQNINYSAQYAESGRTINADPGVMAGTGFEPNKDSSSFETVRMHTEELLSGALGKTWKDEYDAILSSPYFLRREQITKDDPDNRDGLHQQTTHQEMMDFLAGLDDSDDNMYIYTFGTSPKYGYPFQVVVFTQEDLSGAATLETAAEILNANDKPTVQYQAQIHSSEPAATEGALATAKQLDGVYGSDPETGVLKNVDVVMIPRINADGAREWRRVSATTRNDMNRDYLYLSNEEVRMTVGVYNLFLSEVTIDAHEYIDRAEDSTSNLRDMLMTGNSGMLNNPPELMYLSRTIMNTALSRLEEDDYGLRGYAYSGTASSTRAVVGASYPACRGGLGFLLETKGIHNGMTAIDRRVMAQYAAASSIISYVADNADTVMQTVHESRAKIAEQGGTYEEDDLVVLDHAAGTTKEWKSTSYNCMTGEVTTTKTLTWTYPDVIVRSRVRPTAYVIPKDIDTADEIAELMSLHAVQYYELGAGSSVRLQQYKGNDTEATLSEESVVTFAGGAYVFPMNQVPATILAVIMEPDVTDSVDTKSTLYRMGLVEGDAEGYLPIYRYCYDLVDGKITTENTISISYDANGGSGTMNPSILAVVDGSATLTVPVCTFTAPECKQFIGWDYGQARYLQPGETVEFSADTTLSAVWEDMDALASFGGSSYGSIALAIAAADAAGGGTVKLLADVTETPVRVTSGVTLDLAGRKLTATMFVAFAGSSVVDSSEGDLGRLVCANPMIQSTTCDFPILTDSGYLFTAVSKMNQTGSGDGSKYTYIFLPKFAAGESALGALGWDADVHFKLVLSWDGGEKVLDYTSDLIKDVYANDKAFYAWITNYASYVEKNLTVTVTAVSDLGPTVTGTPWTIS